MAHGRLEMIGKMESEDNRNEDGSRIGGDSDVPESLCTVCPSILIHGPGMHGTNGHAERGREAAGSR